MHLLRYSMQVFRWRDEKKSKHQNHWKIEAELPCKLHVTEKNVFLHFSILSISSIWFTHILVVVVGWCYGARHRTTKTLYNLILLQMQMRQFDEKMWCDQRQTGVDVDDGAAKQKLSFLPKKTTCDRLLLLLLFLKNTVTFWLWVAHTDSGRFEYYCYYVCKVCRMWWMSVWYGWLKEAGKQITWFCFRCSSLSGASANKSLHPSLSSRSAGMRWLVSEQV